MAGNWSHHTMQIVEFAIIAIFGFGIALYLGSTLLTALPAGTAANAVTNVIGGFSTAISTVLVPVISIIFVLFLYMIVKASGLLGGKKE